MQHDNNKHYPGVDELSDETKTYLRETLLSKGYTIKEGLTDLKPYVYEAIIAILVDTDTLQRGSDLKYTIVKE